MNGKEMVLSGCRIEKKGNDRIRAAWEKAQCNGHVDLGNKKELWRFLIREWRKSRRWIVSQNKERIELSVTEETNVVLCKGCGALILQKDRSSANSLLMWIILQSITEEKTGKMLVGRSTSEIGGTSERASSLLPYNFLLRSMKKKLGFGNHVLSSSCGTCHGIYMWYKGIRDVPYMECDFNVI